MAKDVEELLEMGPEVVGIHAPLELLSNNVSTCSALLQDISSIMFCLGVVGGTHLDDMSSLDQKKLGDTNALLREAAVRIENALETLRDMEVTRDEG
jgi:hypothetical protein